jgi:hypothetical protein
MVVVNNKINNEKNAGKLLAIFIALRGRMWGASPDGAHPGLS